MVAKIGAERLKPKKELSAIEIYGSGDACRMTKTHPLLERNQKRSEKILDEIIHDKISLISH